MNITLLSVIGVCLYIVMAMSIGYVAYKRNVPNDIDDYFLAGRSVGTMALIGTLFATWFSTFAFIGGPATYYQTGVNWLLFGFFNVFGPIGIWFIGSRFWLLGKKFGFITPSDLLGGYYKHEGVRLMVALISIMALFPYISIQVSGVAKTFAGVTGGQVSYAVAVVVLVLSVGAYSYIGGARAVVWTDAIQGFIFATFLVFTAFMVVKWAGGWQTGWANAVAAHPERMTFTGTTGGQYFTNQLLWVVGWVLVPHLWQRMYMARSAKVLRVSMAFAAPLALWIVTFSGAVIGFMAMGILPTLPAGFDADSLVALLFTQFLPLGGVVLLIAAFAAGMSTADSQMLSVTSIFTRDIYQRYATKTDGKTLQRVSHIFHILFIIAVLGFALIPAGQVMITPLASIGVGLCLLLLPPVIGALYWQRATPQGAFWGLVVGFLVFLAVQFLPGLRPSLPGGFGAPVWAFGVSLLLFYGISMATPIMPAAHRAEYHNFLKSFNAGKEQPQGFAAD
jgi:SSS family solute:Na+ symporter